MKNVFGFFLSEEFLEARSQSRSSWWPLQFSVTVWGWGFLELPAVPYRSCVHLFPLKLGAC